MPHSSYCTTFNASRHLAVEETPVLVAQEVQCPEEKWKTIAVGKLSIPRRHEKLMS